MWTSRKHCGRRSPANDRRHLNNTAHGSVEVPWKKDGRPHQIPWTLSRRSSLGKHCQSILHISPSRLRSVKSSYIRQPSLRRVGKGTPFQCCLVPFVDRSRGSRLSAPLSHSILAVPSDSGHRDYSGPFALIPRVVPLALNNRRIGYDRPAIRDSTHPLADSDRVLGIALGIMLAFAWEYL
jgi:hypothetical protein